MARTLIGNIKGKDGRGITSIKKTGTTGPVDTYTITYTNNDTSTFTIKNSDSISLQRQIVPSAAVESSATASQAYAAGDYVVVNGILRKVKSAIAKGDAISDSNSTATTVTGEIATLGDSILHRAIRVVAGTIDGWSGKVTVTTNMPNETGSALERAGGCFFQLRVWAWTQDIGGSPWTKAVQPPDNPSGSNYWWARVPVKVGDGNTQTVTGCVRLFECNKSGYMVYSGASGRDLFISRDGYPYIAIGDKSTFVSGLPAIISADTTVFIGK